jgi:5-formyltetrahydrofolate cyclo-ligase
MQNLSNKINLRRSLIAARRALPPDVKAQADARIAAHLKDWLVVNQIRTLGAYLPMAGEPDLAPLYASLLDDGLQLAMPVVLEKNMPLHYAQWQPGDALTKDASGTMAPATRAAFAQVDAMLAPCLGFTLSRLRLGYGGGYFDRTLSGSPRPLAVGIAYAFTEVEFEAGAHDVALDLIITEAHCFNAVGS